MDAATSKAAQQSSRRPIDILPDQLSFFFGNLHPILILSLLLFSFTSLVKDPRSILLGLAPTIALIQLAYCVLCLPSTGQAPPSATRAGQKKKSAAKQVQDLGARIVPAFLSLLLTVVLATPLLFIVIILFGGPLTSNTLETLLLALHFALLTAPQLFYAHGLDSETWFTIGSLQLPVDDGYGMSLGACVGAWVGAVPIPLDWDRSWQRWPVTIVVGLFIGAVLGKVVGGHVFKGIRMRIT